jgi:hypothetical protein
MFAEIALISWPTKNWSRFVATQPPDRNIAGCESARFQLAQHVESRRRRDRVALDHGIHAALYAEPLRFRETGDAEKPFLRSLVLPFPKAPKHTGTIEPLLVQHVRFVDALKSNRLRQNVDRIHCNKGQLVYECVWDRFDDTDDWMCVFGLNVCDWKDLGGAPQQPALGCAGFYLTDTAVAPDKASLGIRSAVLLPNYDRLDPFAP